ncbi:BZ3500_MvSof-1268-A1-R1_Chr2-1g04675 [Microbotryum saponariae]|uniref:BZ3500_MvSof-1268-A1-R1_Chr2-1g04675 protein n=1 Tax=Microbotryum saponariae TaxID=289078 RepID=A0A2X0MDR2_9BASI|nr:BZ3500_MvSof-1268-A1-R1_Chr2-1g04675 [Microbotryum saponariae]SCZ92290.1 BZ3501_MvSof-1269-A2-R1_Chr2-1g04331 [Microbotryum saponariae]
MAVDSLRLSSVEHVHLSFRTGGSTASPQKGSLQLTPHGLVFRSGSSDAPHAASDTVIKLPFSLIHSVSRGPPNHDGSPSAITIRTRDFLVYDLFFREADEANGIWDRLKALCAEVAAHGIQGLYAFSDNATVDISKVNGPDAKGKGKAGWMIYSPEAEFARMGLGTRSRAWRFTALNEKYDVGASKCEHDSPQLEPTASPICLAQLCPSYPPQIVVPQKISDTTLNYAVKYRSKGRIPGLVYLHWANLVRPYGDYYHSLANLLRRASPQGSITRSSQPMVGITQGARSIQDEKLVECIFTSHSQHSHPRQAMRGSSTRGTNDGSAGNAEIVYGAQATNIIIDARPTKNAYANSIKGAGSENMSFYRNCRKEYLGIDNIHVMRSSLNGIFDALRDSELTGTLDRLALRKTNWLAHLTNILDGVRTITRTIHLYNSHVLVHCSDGWDRTSQLSALPQLCLDPYYRTAAGLAVLIEKDWLSYGHRFTDRTGLLCGDRIPFVQARGDDSMPQQAFFANVSKSLGATRSNAKEVCPVFQQFLDCIYQIQRQFPTRFEWNDTLLRRLHYESYTGRSGTFVFNSERDRSDFNARDLTSSVWEEFFEEVSTGPNGETELRLKAEFVNHLYDPSLDDPTARRADADQGVLFLDPQDVRWWYALFNRSDEEMNGSPNEIHPQVVEEAVAVVVPQPSIEPGGGASLNGSRPQQFQTASATVDTSITDRDPRPTSRSTAASPTSPTSATPLRSGGSLPLEVPSQAQVAEAVSSVQRFGWSAWKSVQKYGQDAAQRFEARAAAGSVPSQTLLAASPARTQSPVPSPNGATTLAGQVDGLSVGHSYQPYAPASAGRRQQALAQSSSAGIQDLPKSRTEAMFTATPAAVPVVAPTTQPQPAKDSNWDPLGVGSS